MAEEHDGSGGDEGTPRWVKGFAIALAVLALLFIILHFAGGPRLHGGHSPGADAPSEGRGVRP